MARERAQRLLEKLGIELRDDGEGQPLRSIDPTTGEVQGEVRAVSRRQYDARIGSALGRFDEWRMRPAPKRGELIRELGEQLRAQREPLGELVSLEAGKIRAEGIGEVQEMIDICDFAVGLSRQLHGLTIASERPRHRLMEQWHPLGPVGIVTAFNFPVAVWSWNAALAAVCGDVCVWKPSPLTPLCSAAVQAICERVAAAHGAQGVFALVPGGAEPGGWLCDDPRVPLVSFTGSIATGRLVAGRVAARLGRTILELGGNNGVIVLDDADLDLAVRAITFGSVGTAGQRCTTTRRLFVQRGVARALIDRLVSAYRTIRIGPPLEEGVLMGPLITAAAVDRYRAGVAAAKEQGGRVVCGGRVLDRPGNFVEPTVVLAPAHDAFPIAWEETFAPILYVFEVADLEEALRAHNAVTQGLSSAIFTDSLRSAEQFLSPAGSDCGIANVNAGTSGAEIGGAFGGEKETGGGRESGSDAWKAYMRRQTSAVNWGRDLPLAQGIVFG
ncbi:MAG TPA: aldehyde dehydrogenase family protein [Myxococcales bacterium]|nr:aldehyde dehydrogenase family protein [Myxococcales bacterium]